MDSSIPEQYRAVDPFASYDSNTVNQLVEIRARAENVLDIPCGLDVISDSTSPNDTVIVRPGYAFKDDVMIYVSEEHSVDFNDQDQYVSFGSGFDEAGNYYIVLEYTYIKSRPAPQARIKIVKPSQRGNYDYGNSSTSLVFLKSVNVIWTGSEFNINSLADYDSTLIVNQRQFAKMYGGAVVTLPTFDRCRDRGRILYVLSEDKFYFGLDGAWKLVGGSSLEFAIDTDSVTVGDLCYVDSTGKAAAAIVTSSDTAADMIAIEIGTVALGTGKVTLTGHVEDVNVDSTSPAIVIGDLLYLSGSEAGTVTSTETSPLSQVVGRALTDEAASKVDILFFPRAVLESGTTAKITDTLSGVDWVLDSGSYRGDVDISGLNITGQDVTVSCRDTADDMVITPQDIDLSVADTVRIWMPANTVTLVVSVVG